MDLYPVAQLPELLVDMELSRCGFLARSLELYEERPTAWKEEHTVRPPNLSMDVEL